METTWFLIFLYGTGVQPLKMDDFTACVVNAAYLSERDSIAIACISPRANGIDEGPMVFTNGVMEPAPK